jgi:hypothetical protein
VADPVKEQIAANIVTSLQAISTGSGYYTNAGDRVLKRLEHIAEVDGSNLPTLYAIYDGEAVPTIALGGNCFRSVSSWSIWGYVEGDDNLGDDAIKLEADIKVAMLTDLSRGGLAESTMLQNPQTDEGWYGDIGRAIVIVPFDITYKWTLTAP